MHRSKNMTQEEFDNFPGTKFGKLTVSKYHGRIYKNQIHAWECTCECGGTIIKTYGNLKKGLEKGSNLGCGCTVRTKNPDSPRNHPLYPTWTNLKSRHRNGIMKVCLRWTKSFKAFVTDVGCRPDGLVLSPADRKSEMSPVNFTWRTPTEARRLGKNIIKLSAHGKTLCIAEWATLIGCSRQAICFRLKSGWTPEEALTIAPGCSRGKCRASHKTITVGNKTVPFTEWIGQFPENARNTIRSRIANGWTPEEASGETPRIRTWNAKNLRKNASYIRVGRKKVLLSEILSKAPRENHNLIRGRLAIGWTPEEALTIPAGQHRNSYRYPSKLKQE